MDQIVLNTEQDLQNEITNKIKRRRKFELMDYRLAHLFLWISILASFVSTISVASGKIGDLKIYFAVIAGIPGLVIVIDKTFDFKRSAVWGTMFRIELEELKDDFTFKKIDSYQVAKKLREIERKFESSNSKIGFFSRKD